MQSNVEMSKIRLFVNRCKHVDLTKILNVEITITGVSGNSVLKTSNVVEGELFLKLKYTFKKRIWFGRLWGLFLISVISDKPF